ncbi:hypothetical protein PPTG_19214 [Phytophthora nicotianae INRA-310]|uniref:Uncharacterized protein n=1 Tax=Phytophthora nicotianae (strain INRA-310) TaxID=761204 RepID=W2PCW5_PHYN3|nr:hypothetical protein PPTG_19214 [Phytophthora nicotianae INRA-310]ETM98882.1 hypothetical protein PPTG_19214 [Phytophthora nicotianae INRA-310]
MACSFMRSYGGDPHKLPASRLTHSSQQRRQRAVLRRAHRLRSWQW